MMVRIEYRKTLRCLLGFRPRPIDMYQSVYRCQVRCQQSKISALRVRKYRGWQSGGLPVKSLQIVGISEYDESIVHWKWLTLNYPNTPHPSSPQSYNIQFTKLVNELTCKTNTSLYFFANSRTTWFICLHGSAQGAQKLISDIRCRSLESNSWKWSGDSTSTKFEGFGEDMFIVPSIVERY